jgi:hypothetical protein
VPASPTGKVQYYSINEFSHSAREVAALCGDLDVDHSAPSTGGELDSPSDLGEQRIVAAAAHTVARMEVGSALPHNDLASFDLLAAVTLDA